MTKKYTLLFLFLLGIFHWVSAQTDFIPNAPNPPKLVNDYAEVLSPAEESTLESRLRAFDDSTGTQIAIAIVKSIGDYDKASFTTTLAKRWKVGHEKNNGVVIMVKPKFGREKGNAYIAIGKGLEGVIPDITAKRIVEKEMIPHFKSGQYFEGIDAATDIVIKLANGEFQAQDYEKKNSKKGIPTPLIFIIVIAIILISSLFRKKNSNATYGGSDLPFWLAMMMSSGGRSGNYGDFRSGGGDFGGFGGGDFGGGGAGGDW